MNLTVVQLRDLAVRAHAVLDEYDTECEHGALRQELDDLVADCERGDPIAPVARENGGTTRGDAIARINLARLGSMVKPNGAQLGPENVHYLLKLRSELYDWVESIEGEIIRIDHRAAAAIEAAAR